MRPPSRRAAPAAAVAPAQGSLHLYVRCHDVVFAVDTAWVDRLFTPDEVGLHPVRPGEPASQAEALVGAIDVSGRLHTAWDLGALVGLPPVATAWVALRGIAVVGGAEIPLALRTGACLLVAPIPPVTPVPRGIFRARRAAFTAVFPTEGVAHVMGGDLVGLRLDPSLLWTPSELTLSGRVAAGEGLARPGQ